MPQQRKSATPRRGASPLTKPEVKPKQKKKVSLGWLTHIPWPLLTLVMVLSGFLYGAASVTKVLVSYLDQPIAQVVITGDTKHLDVSTLKNEMMLLGQQGFVSSEMEYLRSSAEQFGWVQSVKIKRFWPYGVELDVTEHIPVARWGKAHLLSTEGEVFEVSNTNEFKALPELYSSEGQELEMMAAYRDLSRMLASVGMSIESLTRSNRGAWLLVCRNKLKLNLGRDQINQKINKFVSVYKLTLHEKIEQIEQVDLRYTNGLAVAWKSQKQKI